MTTIEKLREQQRKQPEFSTVWTVAEQLKMSCCPRSAT